MISSLQSWFWNLSAKYNWWEIKNPRKFSIANSSVGIRQMNFKNRIMLYLETKDNANLIEWLWAGLWEDEDGWR